MCVVAGIALVVSSAPAVVAAESWSQLGATGANIRSFAIDPVDQNRVYAAARNDGIWRSNDRGRTWKRSSSGLDFIAAWGVSVDPSNPSVVWAATEVGGAYRSTNFGDTWNHTHGGMTDSVADYTVMVPAQVSSDSFGSWDDDHPEKANRGGMWGYPVDQCVSEQNQAQIPQRCADRANWPLGGYDYRDPDVDADTPGEQPAATPYPRFVLHFQFSSDVKAFPGGAWLTAFRGSNNRLGGGAFRTSDGGATWEMAMKASGGTRLVDRTSGGSGNLWRVRFAPSDSKRVYLAGTGGVWRSNDGGETWVGDAPVAIGSGESNIPVLGEFIEEGGSLEARGLAVHPVNPDVVYAGSWGGGLFKSTDGGATWSSSSNGMPEGSGVWDVVVNPVSPDNLFAALWWEGIYRSTDGGANWTPFNAGLPEDLRKQVYALDVDRPASPQNLYAGTIDGVWGIASDTLAVTLAATGGGSWTLGVGVVLLGLGLLLGHYRRRPAG